MNENLSTPSTVLIIDDEPEQQRPVAKAVISLSGLSVLVRHPNEVTMADIEGASVVLVDYVIEYWDSVSEDEPLSVRPSDGVALGTLLRRKYWDSENGSPVAFALYSGDFKKIWSDQLPVSGSHALARAFNFDWAFAKSSVGIGRNLPVANLASQLEILASAVINISGNQYDLSSTQELESPFLSGFLTLTADAQWAVAAQRQIEQSNPPLHTPKDVNNVGLARWLLHRIMPYPSFLVTEHYVASRFRISVQDAKRLLDRTTNLSRHLAHAKYFGQLAEFDGPRWWRAGIDWAYWDLVNEVSQDERLITKKIAQVVGSTAKLLGRGPRVACVDENLEFEADLHPINNAVRLALDDWPRFAEQAWASKQSVFESEFLRRQVDSRDLELLDHDATA